MAEKTHAGKPDPDEAAAPKSRFRWVYFVVGTVALLLCLALISWFSILSRFAEQRLIDTLNELGFEQVSLQVEEVGLGEARVTNIRLGGKDPVTIGKITARYKLGEAMGGQLGTVDIEGLELKAVAEQTVCVFRNWRISSCPTSRWIGCLSRKSAFVRPNCFLRIRTAHPTSFRLKRS